MRELESNMKFLEENIIRQDMKNENGRSIVKILQPILIGIKTISHREIHHQDMSHEELKPQDMRHRGLKLQDMKHHREVILRLTHQVLTLHHQVHQHRLEIGELTNETS
jgi:hypothetical protein